MTWKYNATTALYKTNDMVYIVYMNENIINYSIGDSSDSRKHAIYQYSHFVDNISADLQKSKNVWFCSLSFSVCEVISWYRTK